ncbi:MAG: LCP family protein [Patescibacteria group bacterium]|nr:LCP family protein [Patescibacteria group bacterium]
MDLFFGKHADRKQSDPAEQKTKFYKKRWFIVSVIVLFLLFGGIGGFLYKTGYILNKISESDSSIIGSLLGVLPGVGKAMKEDDGRINVILLGMRGQNVPGGGLLADTVMIVSFIPDENKMALISIPRDLYVEVPGTKTMSKINSVYAFGEENGKRQGLSQMKKIVGEISGLDIHYAVALNFIGFKQLVDVVGGIEITLKAPFHETTQFVKGNECGGQFFLPKGVNDLNGEKALCYVRARENTSDFDRAKRQQVVLQALKAKLLSIGTFADFGKVNNILNTVGDNVRTDMSASEMKKFYDEYSSIQNPQMYQRVFENSEEGLLMVPQNAPKEAGYILIPREGYNNYAGMQYVCQNIFTIDSQSDIDPVRQYYKPAPKTQNNDQKSVKDSGGNKIEIRVKGKLKIADGLEYGTKLKIKKIEIDGKYKKDYCTIHLDDLDKVKRKGEIKVRVEDLNLSDDIKVLSYGKRDTVLLITVTEEVEGEAEEESEV